MTVIFTKEELSEIFHQNILSDIGDICVNSNEAKPGDLFIALKGEKTDAHNFVNHALDKGSALAIVEKTLDRVENSKLIKVDSSYDALLNLSRYNLAKSNAKYIGVTGSVGKTTTRDLIFHILRHQPGLENNIYVTQKNFNSQIGLPICASTMPRNTKIGIFEMGMSSLGDIKKLINIVSPNISVITQICETHVKFFNSILDVAKAKSEIFETQVPQDATIIPADSAYTKFLINKAKEYNIKNVFSFGFQKSDAQIIYHEHFVDHTKIIAEILGEKIEFVIRCNNNSCIPNSIASILAAHIISDIPLQQLANTLDSFLPSKRRGEITFIKNRNIILIDDTYNACPTSVKSAIQSLTKYTKYRKILVIGDMLELGNDELYYHESLSATIDKFDIDLVFACGELSKHLFNNLMDKKKGAWCENSVNIASKVLEKIRDGDCILIKGSRSMKTEYVVEAIKNMV